MTQRIYRINIIVQEYDGDGFWDIFQSTEMSATKKELTESLETIITNCKNYINNRVK